MITTGFLNVVYVFVLGIVSLLGSFGEVSANNALTSSIVALKGYYVSLSAFFPLDILLAIVAFDLTFEAGIFLYKVIRWGYQKVPGIN